MNDQSSSRDRPAAPVDATAGERHRPFGVMVVALLQLGTVGLALVGYFAAVTIPWQGTFVRALQDHEIARGSIVAFAALVVVAAIGMWRLSYWGWALMLALVGLALVLDLTTWWFIAGTERNLSLYARMALDVVCAFYLNSSAVQDAFRKQPPTPEPARPVVSTDSAGSVDP